MEKKKSAADMFVEQTQMAMDEEAVFENDMMPKMPAPAAQAVPSRSRRVQVPVNMMKTSEDLQNEKEPLQARVTGALFWRRVIVPPNAYVVHTRIGRKNPVTLGLGVSFRYNPDTDAYLIVPAAMQTIGVVANCISKEKQGVNILAYVQWQINDFAVAYKKLDFSDIRDPLGIVNAQLREQAEAAIKDKIATMPVEEVLTDKEPIIQELTSRLKSVAEGGKDNEGLGIKINTVQIREALVSSTALWEDLQSPFRHQQHKQAEISSLEMNKEIQTRSAQTQLELFRKEQDDARERLNVQEETFRLQRESQERLARQEEELRIQAVESQKALAQKEAELEKERQLLKAQLEKLNLEAEIDIRRRKELADLESREKSETLDISLEAQRVELERKRRDIENTISLGVVLDNLVQTLPEVAEKLPEIHDLRVVSSGGDPRLDSLVQLVAKLFAVVDAEKLKSFFQGFGSSPPSTGNEGFQHT